MANINFNYNKAITNATEIDNIANDLENLMKNNLDTVTSDLDNIWQGEAASLIKTQFSSKREEIMSTVASLRQTSSDIRRAAAIIRKAEEDALAKEEAMRHIIQQPVSQLDTNKTTGAMYKGVDAKQAVNGLKSVNKAPEVNPLFGSISDIFAKFFDKK